MNRLRSLGRATNLCCFAAVAFLGLMSLFHGAEDPKNVLNAFANMFVNRDAEGILKVLLPEIVSQKEISLKDVQAFLERFPSKDLKLEGLRVDKRMKSEEEETERFQGTILFRGPVLAPEYPKGSSLIMVLLWVQEEGNWRLERPLSIRYLAPTDTTFPTADQEEAGIRLVAALDVLDRIGLSGSEAMELIPAPVKGTAAEQYKELERLYYEERGPKGIDHESRGVRILLDAAVKGPGALLKLYARDLDADQSLNRPAPPWEMLKDYVDSAVQLGKACEKSRNKKQAADIYSRIICLGRSILEEDGGLQFVVWGLTFQKTGAEELARVATAMKSPDGPRAQAFLNLTSRRLDLVRTAMGCLDDMVDYKSLKAAEIAAARAEDSLFRPWGISTLTILALKGAPAAPEVIRKAGALVMVDNPVMRQAASTALDKLAASDSSGRLRAFIARQKEWVSKHDVYGSVKEFR